MLSGQDVGEYDALFWGAFTYALSGFLIGCSFTILHLGFNCDSTSIGVWFFRCSFLLSYMARLYLLRSSLFCLGMALPF